MNAPGSSGSRNSVAVDSDRPKRESAGLAPIAAADPIASQPRVWRDGRLRTSRTVSPKRSRHTLGDRPFSAVRVRNDSAGRFAVALSAEGGTIGGRFALPSAGIGDAGAATSCARAPAHQSNEQATKAEITCAGLKCVGIVLSRARSVRSVCQSVLFGQAVEADQLPGACAEAEKGVYRVGPRRVVGPAARELHFQERSLARRQRRWRKHACSGGVAGAEEPCIARRVVERGPHRVIGAQARAPRPRRPPRCGTSACRRDRATDVGDRVDGRQIGARDRVAPFGERPHQERFRLRVAEVAGCAPPRAAGRCSARRACAPPRTDRQRARGGTPGSARAASRRGIEAAVVARHPADGRAIRRTASVCHAASAKPKPIICLRHRCGFDQVFARLPSNPPDRRRRCRASIRSRSGDGARMSGRSRSPACRAS